VEYEGEGHSGAEQIVRDIAREEDYGRAGWLLVRISKRHMQNDARSAVAKVRAALLSRGWGEGALLEAALAGLGGEECHPQHGQDH
jgi:hypothetical protein